MITLITGAPGSGKTLYTIDKLIRPLIGSRVVGTDDEGRPEVIERVVYSNINGLLLEHEVIDAEWLQNLHEHKKPGMVVVFDEVQRVWPNRVTGSKKPPAVEYLETHRHDGIDVIIMTQNPQLLDPAVRALVGRHLHMRRVGAVGAAIVYEWDACSNALNFKSAFKKTPYRYSKEVFKLYKSAKIHTKQSKSIPFAVWVALAGVGAAMFMWPRFIGALGDQKPAALAGNQVEPVSVVAEPPRWGASGSVAATASAMTRQEYFASLRPRHQGLPHTAPRYDAITQPQRAPVPAACIESKSKGCQCWSQDATPMVLPVSTCQAIVSGGLFLDFKPDQPGALQVGAVVGSGAVHWSANGDPRASVGSQPVAALVPGDVLTASDIARHSRATTGSNPWARDAGQQSRRGDAI